jgi:hypothetical protein
MEEVTSKKMRKILPLWSRKRMARALPRRRVRRCPYLFSVAPRGFNIGLPEQLTPPARENFPPTHDLLDSAWRSYLKAMEGLLLKAPLRSALYDHDD